MAPAPIVPWFALSIGLGLAAVSLTRPVLLKPLNIRWFRFGLLLHRIVNPLVMFAVFTVVFVPVGVVMRIWRDPLRLRRPTGSTYWIERRRGRLFGIDKLNIARSDVPAVTHVDYSSRVQTVHAETNPRYHALLSAFERRTGCAALVNTSFNVRGEPIVGTPEDAFRCFMGTEMEVLVCGNAFLHKDQQDPQLAQDYKSKYGLD